MKKLNAILKNKTRMAFLLLGIIILFQMFRNFGIKQFLDDIISLGWRFSIILLLFFFNHIFLSLSWKILINYKIKWSRFYKLVLARIAGDSASFINAAAAIAGEPLKAMYIKDIVPFRAGLASVILDRTVHTLANTIMILTGIVFSFFILDLPRLYSLGFLLFILAFLFFVVYLIKKQRQGFIAFIIGKFPKKFAERFKKQETREKIEEIDKEIAYILSSRENSIRFYLSLGIKYVSIFITGTLEVYLILNFISTDISIVNSIFVYLFNLFLTSLFFFIPANVGTSEVSYSSALKLLNFNGALQLGITIGLIGKARRFIWASIGMLIFFYGGARKEK